jgi:hypothetical protein
VRILDETLLVFASTCGFNMALGRTLASLFEDDRRMGFESKCCSSVFLRQFCDVFCLAHNSFMSALAMPSNSYFWSCR